MSLDHLPDEIVHLLLYYVSPEDTLLSVQSLSRRIHSLANEPLLWKYHCKCSFRFWNTQHEFDRKQRLRAQDCDWKQLFVFRYRRNVKISQLFEEILLSSLGRVKRFEQICRVGYDAKDYLLAQCQANNPQDLLARRYYAASILDSLHRSIAIHEWRRLRAEQEGVGPNAAQGRLERALGAFDMFVIHQQDGNIEDIGRWLDEIAAEFQGSTPKFHDQTTRQKALALNRYLRMQNLVGLREPERNYRNLRNCLIGQALRHEEHESIPIISSAIYCCVAERLGLSAQCSAFPGHVHAMVHAAPGETLDGRPLEEAQRDSDPERMYLDPFGCDDEVPLSSLRELLQQMGFQSGEHLALAPVSPVITALRTSHNIRASAERLSDIQQRTTSTQSAEALCRLRHGSASQNMEAAAYAAQWAKLLLTRVDTFEWERDVTYFVRRFHHYLSEDAWLVERYLEEPYDSLWPLRAALGRHFEPEITVPWELLRRVRLQDASLPDPKPRRSLGEEAAPFKIGNLVRNTRAGWVGVVVGWKYKASPSLGTYTLFYECLRESQPGLLMSAGDGLPTVSVVHLELVNDASRIKVDKFPAAGKYFKRFDRDACSFVSNMREEYPDD